MNAEELIKMSKEAMVIKPRLHLTPYEEETMVRYGLTTKEQVHAVLTAIPIDVVTWEEADEIINALGLNS